MKQPRKGLAQQPRRSMLMTVGAASDLRRETRQGRRGTTDKMWSKRGTVVTKEREQGRMESGQRARARGGGGGEGGEKGESIREKEKQWHSKVADIRRAKDLNMQDRWTMRQSKAEHKKGKEERGRGRVRVR
eukprot:2696235-Pleurochrysis_carterae.AAC.1